MTRALAPAGALPGEPDALAPEPPCGLRAAWGVVRGQPLALAGFALVALIVLAALFAPLIAPYDPAEQRLAEKLQLPSRAHLLGTDQLGRDILSRLLWGAQISLQMGIVAVALGLTLGIVVGFLSGYMGGWADLLLMRLVDVLLAFPLYLLAILVMAILGPSLMNATVAVGVATFPHFARLVRGETLAIKERDFVEAARALGGRRLRVGFLHILPHTLGPIVVLATFRVATAIIVESSLSFLGLGPPPPTPAWGLMISEGRIVLRAAPWVAGFPGCAILVLVLGFNLAGDGLRDALDPRLRGAATRPGAA